MERQDRIERTLLLSAPRERVWAAIAEPQQISRWFTNRAEFELAAGAEGRFDWDNHGAHRMRVVTVEPPRRFAFQWQHESTTEYESPFDARPITLVEYLLEEENDGTRLTLVETGFASFPIEMHPKAVSDNEGGWTEQMENLRVYLEG